MITLGELAIGLGAGSVLILLGLVPSLFQRLAEEVRNSIDSLSSFPGQPHRYEQIQTPRFWLAGLGIALIAVSVLGYTSRF